jgi:hypothetical protein
MVLGGIWGHPLKGCLSKAKTVPMQEKDFFLSATLKRQLPTSVPLQQFL